MQRRLGDRLRALARTLPAFGGTLGAWLTAHRTENERASNADLACMLIGISLLMASFAVSLYGSAQASH